MKQPNKFKKFRFLAITSGVIGALIGYFLAGFIGLLIGLVGVSVGLLLLVIWLVRRRKSTTD